MPDDVVGTDDAGLDDALDAFVADPDDNEDAKPAPKAAKEPAPKAAKEPAPKAAKEPAQDKGPAPWEKDLDERGLDDPAYRDYHREVVQPYVTQLEQAASTVKQLFGDGEDGMKSATIASNVLRALDEDPLGTIRDLVEDLEIDPWHVANALGLTEDGDDAPEPGDDAAEPESEEDDMLNWLREFRQSQETKAESDRYDALITALKEDVPDLDETKFHVAMLASQNDPHKAWSFYEMLVGSPEAPAEEDDPIDEDPPPVIGAGVGGIAAPDEKEYSSIEDALDSWVAEERATSRRSR